MGALEGTWELSGDYNITIKTDEAEYKGIALKQWDEDGKKYVMTFTALDSKSGVVIWGKWLKCDRLGERSGNEKKSLSGLFIYEIPIIHVIIH